MGRRGPSRVNVSPRIALALILSGALIALIGLSWAALAPEARAGVGAVLVGLILILLGAHARDA